MLTGRAAELRPDVNYLQVRPILLDVPMTPKTAIKGDFAQALRVQCLNASLRAKRDRMARDQVAAALAAEQGRPWIPRSGPGRRRAKAIRNNEAAKAMTVRWRDISGEAAPFTLTRGRQYETDYVQYDEAFAGQYLLSRSDWPHTEFRLNPAVPDLLTEVLAWCSEHPTDRPLPQSGPLVMCRDGGVITVEGDAPDVLAISADLLTVASREYLTFDGGVLTVDVQPEPLRYLALGPDPRSHVVVFERIREA